MLGGGVSIFSEISAFTVFLAISALGFVFLLLSLMFGEIFDHFGGDFSVDHDHGGPGFFSTRVLSVFVTAFGGTGAIGVFYGLSTLAASGIGFLSGAFFGGLIYSFARFLYGQQASTQVRSSDLLGQQVRVVVSIPPGGVGQVRCRVGDEVFDKVARSHDGKAIKDNALVRVEETLGDVVIVREQ
jgi:membrane protein implicated in regulation of membrane protease activity